MAESKFKLDFNGQQVQKQDLELLGEVSGLADDRVFAELLRMPPYNGSTISRGILPYYATGVSSATVAPSGASGKVRVNPFRALIGSRTSVNTDPKTNLRDIRSTIAVGPLVSGTGTLYTTLSIAANASGNPRWDLICAAVTVDANGASTTRKVKDPATKLVTDQLVAVTTETTVALSVVTGTPAASPDWPAVPADAAGTYYIPLAYVRVPNGFNATSTVATTDICDVAPVIPIARTSGAVNIQIADQHFTKDGSIITAAARQAWGSSGTRPSVYMPGTMVGGEELLVYIDLVTPVHTNDMVVDSRDWSKRLCQFSVTCAALEPPPWQAGIGVPNAFQSPPTLSAADNGVLTGFGQSMKAEGPMANGAFVAYAAGNQLKDASDTSTFGLYVDFNDSGKLKFWYDAANPPGSVRIFFWLKFTAPFANI